MEVNKGRLSNFELLRIVAVFLVMVGHFNAGMGGGIPLFDGEIDGVIIGRNIIASLASICVVLFILISGWFSIKPNLKTIATLWTQIFFINIYMYVLQAFVTGVGAIKGLIVAFLPFTLGNWFVRAYLILLLLSPALNLLVEKLSRKGLLLFLGVFAVMGLVWGCLKPATGSGFDKGLSPVSLIYIYMIGRFMRVHLQLKRSKWFYLGGYFFFSLLIFIGRVFNQRWMLYYCNPILIFSAMSLFLFFAKWDIGYNKVINWIASSVFAVFIFHTHIPVCTWLTDYNIHLLETLPYLKYLCVFFIVLCLVFMVAVLMDKLRALIFKPIISLADRVVISTEKNEKLISINKK